MAPANRADRQRVGDVVSLLGRILRTGFVLIVAVAILASGPLQAAPFAAIVMDARNGEILYEKNANTRLHPASLTKMMTLYIVFQEIEAGNISLDTKVTVSEYAAAQPPSRLGLKPGQKISIRHLIRAAAIKSANDAAAALGDAISGDSKRFAKRMTLTARELGMNNTTFKNANGLTAEGHLSTAYDMNVLGRHLFYDFPQYFGIFSRRTADAGVATVTNTNSRFLDSYEGADGIKTGYTSPAGFNLTASAHRGDKHIIATVFGGTSSADRNAKMAELMDLGFEKAPSKARELPPAAAPLVSDGALVASLEGAIDEIDAEGGAGKIIRVSGEVKVSPRPKARPELPTVPDTVAIAMAESIDGALAEATAPPAPEGTLEFQAEAMVETAAAVETPAAEAVELALAEVEAAEAGGAEAAPAGALEPGTLEAQAATLADPAAAVPVAETAAETAAETIDPALAGAKPKLRPEGLAETSVALADAGDQPEPELETVLVAETEQVAEAPELVMTDPGPDVTRAAEPELLLAEVSAVETVAGTTELRPDPVEIAAATVSAPLADRKAPIFDEVELADASGEEALEEVVVVMSTSGGRHFGVNVGEYPSRFEAERALLKTALAESATLDEGLRKTSQSGGVWRASFMGLTEEQAELACRRLSARAIPCETVGG
ncbi:MAG TPA: D-alanyl-D-alanine carboxypeptidase family protein [Tabrizicola sp.]|nr:D-alanyl-D-alanine carboxypeptidase family protein [Tabrizicola sp.]